MRLRMDVWMVRKKEERRVEKQQEQVDISDSYTKVGGMQARVTRSLKPRLLQTECRLICKEIIERHFSIIAMGSCLSQGQSC
jgi:hypothetical protein